MAPWIENLKHPLVLFGFVLFLLALILRLLKFEKLTGKATERLFTKGLNFVFLLSLMVVFFGFILGYRSPVVGDNTVSPIPPVNTSPSNSTIINQNINIGSGTLNQVGGDSVKNATDIKTPTKTKSVSRVKPVEPVAQQINGNSGVALQAGRDINYQAPSR